MEKNKNNSNNNVDEGYTTIEDKEKQMRNNKFSISTNLASNDNDNNTNKGNILNTFLTSPRNNRFLSAEFQANTLDPIEEGMLCNDEGMSESGNGTTPEEE